MFDDRLTDELADCLARVQRGEGVLEDHLHLLAQGAHFFAGIVGDVLTVEENTAGGRLNELEDGAPGGGLAAAGFAHDAEGLALLNGKADTVNRVELSGRGAGRGAEIFGEVLHLENRFTHQRFLLSLKLGSS